MDDELLREFLNESREHLATIEADLLTIEEGGEKSNHELINKVFRAAHSIKGGSGFLGLGKVKSLAHKAETVLDMLRSQKMQPNAEVINVLLAAFDKLREMLNNAAESEKAEIEDLTSGLTSLASSYLPENQKASLGKNVALTGKDAQRPVILAQVDLERAKRSGQCVYYVDYDLIHDIERSGLKVLQIFRELSEAGEILDCVFDLEAAGTLEGPISKVLPLRLVFATTLASELIPELVLVPENRIQLVFDPAKQTSIPDAESPLVQAKKEELPEPAPEPVTSTDSGNSPQSSAPALGIEGLPQNAPSAAQAASTSALPVAADETLRVNVALLESLMNLAGELVLSRNQLRAAVAQSDMQSLAVADQRLNQITSELQDTIMRTRLQPIGNVFAKFPRVVRDMAQSLDKDIFLDIRGKDVALDRSLIEGLSDPLTHMVRNAVDHGIEPASVRVRSGKAAQGTVRIEAKHEAGQVVVEITDDGKGIDPEKIAGAALSKGLITPEKVRSMSGQEKMALIFLPGLSTAEKVTDISGRGVGMDVVRTNLERLGGKAEISSEIGKGSSFRIKLPLTLAIIPSLIVSVGDERFAIPQVNVEELLRIQSDKRKEHIEVVGGTEVLLLRDRILPLVYLKDLLPLTVSKAQPPASDKANPSALEIVVVTTGTLQYGLAVSAFHETEEIVVKPLGHHLKKLREYAGATILGDGKVALILDIAGVALKADFAKPTDSPRGVALAERFEREKLEESQSFLLFQNSPGEVCATPLTTVLRIERIPATAVELAGNRRTMQYRGRSLPLVTLADAARVNPIEGSKDLAVIVSNVYGHEVGLLGAMPVDVVETKTLIDQVTHRQTGISGSAIIRDRTTLIADVFELVDAVYPEWKGNGTSTTFNETRNSGEKILLAEDSDFFRSQIKKFLEQTGFVVLEAVDGEAAWETLVAHAEEIRALVTDIEMPRLSGLGLAKRVRTEPRFARLPVIALSSLAGEEDVAAGRAAGVSEYLVKLDREQLIATLRKLIQPAGDLQQKI